MVIKDTLEKHAVSLTVTTLFIAIFFIISTTLTVSEWKSETEKSLELLHKSIEHHSNAYNRHDERLTALEDENNDIKVKLATIDAKLSNIELILIEIKEDLKE